MVELAAFDVTVALAAHAEGRLLHRTMRSLQAAVEHASRLGVRTEVVVVLDAASDDTRAYFERNPAGVRIAPVSFRDLSKVRNHAAEIARGEYVAFFDADDLVSENWVSAMHAFAREAQGEVVLHPELSVYFGRAPCIWLAHESTEPTFDPLDLLESNQWGSMCFASRRFLLAHPYAESAVGSGFGFEDWHWNCETLWSGAHHRLVPRTVRFIRSKPLHRSLWGQHWSLDALVRPSSLFGKSSVERLAATPGAQSRYEWMRPAAIPEPEAEPAGPAIRAVAGAARVSYEAARAAYRRTVKSGVDSALIGTFVHRQRSAFGGLVRGERRAAPPEEPPPPPLPAWMVDAWKATSVLEPELWPDAPPFFGCLQPRYESPRSTIKRAYAALVRSAPESPTHVYLLPALARTSSARAVLHHVAAAAEIDPESRVVCVVTDEPDAPWRERLPGDVTVVDVGSLREELGEPLRLRLLVRLLLQWAPRVIHAIDSDLGYQALVMHGAPLRSRSRLHASLPPADAGSRGWARRLATAEIDKCFDVLSGVLADPETIEWLRGTFDLDPSRLHAYEGAAALVKALAGLPGYPAQDAHARA